MFHNKKKMLAVLVAAVTLVTAGTAYALWSANATGTGRSKALTAQTITVTAATGAADLYPGFTGGNVYFTLNNTNPYPVTFTSMTPGTITSSDQANCPASNLSVNSATGLSLAAPANSTTATLSVNGVATLASGAPDGCQNVSFTINLTLAGSQT